MKTTHKHRVLNDPKTPRELKDRIRVELAKNGALGTVNHTQERNRPRRVHASKVTDKTLSTNKKKLFKYLLDEIIKLKPKEKDLRI